MLDMVAERVANSTVGRKICSKVVQNYVQLSSVKLRWLLQQITTAERLNNARLSHTAPLLPSFIIKPSKVLRLPQCSEPSTTGQTVPSKEDFYIFNHFYMVLGAILGYLRMFC